MGSWDRSVIILNEIARWIILYLCVKALVGDHQIEVKIGGGIALSVWLIEAGLRLRRSKN